MDPNVHEWVFRKAIQANGERYDVTLYICFVFTLRDAILKWGNKFMWSLFVYKFEELEMTFCEHYWKV
jgi:hypothetical protein